MQLQSVLQRTFAALKNGRLKEHFHELADQ
jgi:hypothetical protein